MLLGLFGGTPREVMDAAARQAAAVIQAEGQSRLAAGAADGGAGSNNTTLALGNRRMPPGFASGALEVTGDVRNNNTVSQAQSQADDDDGSSPLAVLAGSGWRKGIRPTPKGPLRFRSDSHILVRDHRPQHFSTASGLPHCLLLL